MENVKDEEGNSYGRWLVISRADNSILGNARWLCQCSCGSVKIVDGGSLRNGKSTSCGCYGREQRIRANTTHDMSRTREYKSYVNMLARCYDEKAINYQYYGGRGIIVCQRWLDDFMNFFEDMGERPDNMSLDRINNNGDYAPLNCKWSTRKEQQNNMRSNI